MGGEHAIEYTDTELSCGMPEIYMLLTKVTIIKKSLKIFLNRKILWNKDIERRKKKST